MKPRNILGLVVLVALTVIFVLLVLSGTQPRKAKGSETPPCIPIGGGGIVWGDIVTGTIYAKYERSESALTYSWGVAETITRTDILIENGITIRERGFYTHYVHIEHARFNSWFMAWAGGTLWDSRLVTETVPNVINVPSVYPGTAPVICGNEPTSTPTLAPSATPDIWLTPTATPNFWLTPTATPDPRYKYYLPHTVK